MGVYKINLDRKIDPNAKDIFHNYSKNWRQLSAPEIIQNPENYRLEYTYYKLYNKSCGIAFKPLNDGRMKIEYYHIYHYPNRTEKIVKTEYMLIECARILYKQNMVKFPYKQTIELYKLK